MHSVIQARVIFLLVQGKPWVVAKHYNSLPFPVISLGIGVRYNVGQGEEKGSLWVASGK